MNEQLHIGKGGIDLCHYFEGCHKKVKGGFKAYICPAGELTIGWGHTNHHPPKFKSGEIWSQQKCDDVFAGDMMKFEKDVKRLVTVPLNQNQFDALVSFAYNCGAGNLGKSTLLKKVNAGDFEGAAKEFAKWNKGGGKVLAGLTKRRAAEAKLFSTEHKP
jgi:lysozyme